MSRKASDVLKEAADIVRLVAKSSAEDGEYTTSLRLRSLAMELQQLYDNEIKHEGEPNERTRVVPVPRNDQDT